MDVYKENKSVEYVFLGNSGLKVSNLCLGTSCYGSTTEQHILNKFFAGPTQSDKANAFQILDRYAELGGNFMDTSDAYSKGNSEEIIGEWLSKREREKFVIASKVRFPFDATDENQGGLSRRHIMSSIEGSLRRLRTNYIDLYQLHMWDNGTPIEETMRAIDDLIRCGKIRYFGVSNMTGWQLQKIVDLAKYTGLTAPISLQECYNLMMRTAEIEAFEVCKNERVAVLAYSPLAEGRLTGRFKRDEKLDPTKSKVGFYLANDLTFYNYKMDDKYWGIVEELGKIAETHSVAPMVATERHRCISYHWCIISETVGRQYGRCERLEPFARGGDETGRVVCN